MKKSNELSLGEVIREFVKKHELTGKLAEAEIVAAWSKLLGPAIDRKTISIRLQPGGVVKVRLDSSALRNELSMQRSRLVDLLNKEIGKELIKEIILV